MIIDDGSTDDTAEIVEQWKKDNQITIEYIYQNNRGKHTAHNHGVKLCHTDLFLCVDSDDSLIESAVADIHSWWKSDYNENFMGYCCPKKGEKYIGDKTYAHWPKENTLIDMYELGRKYKYGGETALVLLTKELKKYRFPVFFDERFVTEIVLYYQFKKMLKVKKNAFYLYRYQEDGYTRQGQILRIKNPKGEALSLACRAMKEKTFHKRLKWKIRYYAWVKYWELDSNIVGVIDNLYDFNFDGYENKLAQFLSYFHWIRKKSKIDKIRSNFKDNQ